MTRITIYSRDYGGNIVCTITGTICITHITLRAKIIGGKVVEKRGSGVCCNSVRLALK